MHGTVTDRCPWCKHYIDIFVDGLGAHVIADVPEGHSGAKGKPTGPQTYGKTRAGPKALDNYPSKTTGGRLLQQNAEEHQDAMYPPNMPRNRRLEDE